MRKEQGRGARRSRGVRERGRKGRRVREEGNVDRNEGVETGVVVVWENK